MSDIEEHPEIPSGFYCYNIVEIVPQENGLPRIVTKVCPHWERTEEGAQCKLINENHHHHCCFHLVWDQVKHCEINMDRDYEPIIATDEEYRKQGLELETILCKCGKEVEVWSK